MSKIKAGQTVTGGVRDRDPHSSDSRLRITSTRQRGEVGALARFAIHSRSPIPNSQRGEFQLCGHDFSFHAHNYAGPPQTSDVVGVKNFRIFFMPEGEGGSSGPYFAP